MNTATLLDTGAAGTADTDPYLPPPLASTAGGNRGGSDDRPASGTGEVTTPLLRRAWHAVIRLVRPAARAATPEEWRLRGELARARDEADGLRQQLGRERDEADRRRRDLETDLDIARGQLKILGKEVEMLANLNELNLARVQAATSNAVLDGAIPTAMGRHPESPPPRTLSPFAARQSG